MDIEWLNSRRTFVKTILLSGVALQLPWIQSCAADMKKNIPVPGQIYPLERKDFLNLYLLLDWLFPEDGNGPGAITVKADHYFIWVVNDKENDTSTTNFLLANLKRFNEEAIKKYKLDFHELSQEDQESFIADLAGEKWSKKWFSRLITLIFEALLLDPQYHVNPNHIGWDWLDHNPGFPRPTKEQLYPTILRKKHEV